MPVKFVDPSSSIDRETIEAVEAVLKSGVYTMGENCGGFESEFSKFIGSGFSSTVSSGTAALHLALLALGLKNGDEVITTPYTFIATTNAILYAGCRPVFVDIDPETFTIDPSKIEEVITPNTKAIMPVHLYGHPADMGPIMEIAEKHGICVIEDACQAAGASYRGKKVGSIGNAACFSFYPTKPMMVGGDGGMVTTGSSEVKKKIDVLKNQGSSPDNKYLHNVVGFNYRMGEIMAAVGRVQLRHLPKWLEARKRIAAGYSRRLSGLGDLVVPKVKDWAESAHSVYTIRTSHRDFLLEFLRENGIAAGVYYPVPVHLQEPYRGLSSDMPFSEKAAKEVISLPVHPFMGKPEVEAVSDNVMRFFKEADRHEP
jgi:perosamine synthetase